MSHTAPRRFHRRQVLGAAAALGAGAAFLGGYKGIQNARALAENHHSAWVWQLSTDGEPDVLGARLRQYGLGIILKTHDGDTWMSKYDSSSYAVSGPAQIQTLVQYFEDAGVPFHAWCVVHGTRPEEEAQMAAAVLLSGARSLYLDLEPYSGFWEGTPADATAFGAELRRLAPNGNVIVSIDPRPWVLDELPIPEFAEFCNAMAPQNYWRTFDTQANYEKFAGAGYNVPPEGVTPEFLLAVGQSKLKGYGLPLIEVGQGDTNNPNEWERFIDAAYTTGVDFVTVWRYGVTPESVFAVLANRPPRQAPVAPAIADYTPPPAADPIAAAEYVVQAGDTLGGIAATHGTTVEEIMAANGLSDPNYIYAGQVLQIPGTGGTGQATAESPVEVVASEGPPADAGGGNGGGGGLVHTVQDGDTLYAIAGQYGVDVNAISSANGIADPDFLFIGQQLTIPA